jgi:phosphohistidine phosphatase
MKTVYLIRHAKSSWDDPDLSDFQRPLNERGKRDAPRMGKRLNERDLHPDVVISSPAKRALSTAKRICNEIGFPKENIKTDRALYHGGEEGILGVIREIKDKHDLIFVFGHNPGLTDFTNTIVQQDTYQFIDNIPTCGVVAFTFDVDSWSEINWKTGKMILYDFPKSKND